MLLMTGKGKEQLQLLANIQIETSDFEWVTNHSYSFPINTKCISKKEIDMLVSNPRLLLQACTMHFNSFIYNIEGKETNIVERMFFSKDEIELIWELIKQIFQRPILFKGRTIFDNQVVYRVDARGVTPFGDALLKALDGKELIPDIWKKLYLLDRVPPTENEGTYYFDSFPMMQEPYSQNLIDKLLMDPYFRFMDISNISLVDCEKNKDIQKILSRSQEAVIFVEKYEEQCIKRLCWKWKDRD